MHGFKKSRIYLYSTPQCTISTPFPPQQAPKDAAGAGQQQ
jgi:hypothetical protein